ncbi:hypothetical protein HMPREF1989_01413 [Porphyromonas gingivalis F0566]|nr:hypothetical protein HMPREF1989_01413 [Porphyromonas gingivalis F0566]
MPPAEKPKPSSMQEGFGFFFMSECEGRIRLFSFCPFTCCRNRVISTG